MPQTKEFFDFVFYEDIIYYDGLALSVGITKDNQSVLIVWLDENREKEFSLYAYVFISDSELELFLTNQKLYYDVLKDSIGIVTWKLDLNGYFDVQNITHKNFLEEYGPQKDVSLEDEVKSFYPTFQKFKDNVKKSSLVFDNNVKKQ